MSRYADTSNGDRSRDMTAVRIVSDGRPQPTLVEVLDELLEASADTVELASGATQLEWLAHLDYLRALQRLGQASLARLA